VAPTMGMGYLPHARRRHPKSHRGSGHASGTRDVPPHVAHDRLVLARRDSGSHRTGCAELGSPLGSCEVRRQPSGLLLQGRSLRGLQLKRRFETAGLTAV
jgi:hypothetical protein